MPPVFLSKSIDLTVVLCYNSVELIKSGGGTGPVKPGNLIAKFQKQKRC